MPVTFTVADFKFWGICLVNISVGMVIATGSQNQGPLNGGVSNGGFPDLDLSFLFCPFSVLFGTFPISLRSKISSEQ